MSPDHRGLLFQLAFSLIGLVWLCWLFWPTSRVSVAILICFWFFVVCWVLGGRGE